jgi:hypothetical protein
LEPISWAPLTFTNSGSDKLKQVETGKSVSQHVAMVDKNGGIAHVTRFYRDQKVYSLHSLKRGDVMKTKTKWRQQSCLALLLGSISRDLW